MSIRKRLIVLILLIICGVSFGCGSGTGGGDGGGGKTVTPTDTNDNNITISGSLSDSASSLKPAPMEEYRLFYAVSDWSGAAIQVIDSSGNILATTTANSDGNFSVSVPPGTNYFLRASIGNLVLKAFIGSVRSSLSNVDINPTSSALVKILAQLLGNVNCGEPGVNVSGELSSMNVSDIISSIASNSSLSSVADAIAQDIADNYDSAGTTPSVGNAGSAGDLIASDIADTISGGDTTPPTVSSTNPADSATGLVINSAITVTFSEPIDAPTITTATFTINDGVGNIPGTVSYSGTIATFTPSANLDYSTTYIATITTGVTDLASNPLGTEYSWSFATGTLSDTTPPTVSLTNPVNGATAVAINSAITATFSEQMDASTLTTSSFTVNDITGTVTYRPSQKYCDIISIKC